MASKIAARRLNKELEAMRKEQRDDPVIRVAPDEKNILNIHYVIEGSPGTPYENGIYHGKLVFPPEYPMKPPSVLMLTPNGRFQTNRRLCLSMSDFHPETWNPIWSIDKILMGLYSFMLDTEITTGAIESSDEDKRAFAAKSLAWNAECDDSFLNFFPEYRKRLKG